MLRKQNFCFYLGWDVYVWKKYTAHMISMYNCTKNRLPLCKTRNFHFRTRKIENSCILLKYTSWKKNFSNFVKICPETSTLRYLNPFGVTAQFSDWKKSIFREFSPFSVVGRGFESSPRPIKLKISMELHFCILNWKIKSTALRPCANRVNLVQN